MGRSRIYRFATNHDIKNPQSLTIDDCKLGIASANALHVLPKATVRAMKAIL
jgi:hypothetical protein